MQLVAHWSGDATLLAALDGLPEPAASAPGRSTGAPRCAPLQRRAEPLCRSAAASVSASPQEAALKLKETCGLHAEAFSAAEVRHGPMALVGPGFPVLAFAQDDETRAGVEAAIAAAAAQGAPVLKAGGGDAGAASSRLPTERACPVLEPIAYALRASIGMVNALALARGLDPDRPPHLAKVTETF